MKKRTLFALAVAVIPTLGACTTWRPITEPQTDVRDEKRVKLTHRAEPVIVREPVIEGDSLSGTRMERSCVPSFDRLREVCSDQAIPFGAALSEVSDLQVQRLNGGRTALAIVGAAVSVLVFAFLASGGIQFGLSPRY